MLGYDLHFLAQLASASRMYGGANFPYTPQHHASGGYSEGNAKPQVMDTMAQPTQQQTAQVVPDPLLVALLNLSGGGEAIRVRAVTNYGYEIEIANPVKGQDLNKP